MRWLLFFIVFAFGLPLYAQEDSETELVKKSIFFGGGSYYIDELQQEELKTFIQSVENLENYEIVIFSHTDNIGGKEFNQWLSQMRSESVLYELLEIGVPEELTEIKDFGLTNPLYTNSTTGGKIMNRRVDVILVPIVF